MTIVTLYGLLYPTHEKLELTNFIAPIDIIVTLQVETRTRTYEIKAGKFLLSIHYDINNNYIRV